MNKRKPPATMPEDIGLAVYDGQEFKGSVLEMGRAFVSYNANGAFIGAFKNLIEAPRAIHENTREDE